MNETNVTAPVSAIVVAMMDSERDYVLRALDSVRMQTLKVSEILLYVDERNNWIDELLGVRTREVILRRIPLCYHSGVCNLAARDAKSEWLAFLDADDSWLSDRVAKAWEVVESRPDTNFVLVDFWFANPQGQAFAIGRCVQAPPSTWLVRRRLVLDHPFNEKLRFGEDHDWLLRLTGIVTPVRVKRPLVKFTKRADSLTSQPVSAEHRKNRARLNLMSRLSSSFLRYPVLALTYLRYCLYKNENFWTVMFPRYLKDGHPSAVSAARRLGLTD